MAILISNISMGLDCDESDAYQLAMKKISVSSNQVKNMYIFKKSVDARHTVKLVYTIGIELHEGEAQAIAKCADPSVLLKADFEYNPSIGEELLDLHPIIIGFGPAGMFAGLMLAKKGYRPIILERGADIDTRTKKVNQFWKDGILDSTTNVQFGEGGAGTFSDGKLMTRINDVRCEVVLDKFVKNGAPEEIKILAKPHIGTDKLRNIVKNIRKKIESYGGEVRFNSTVDKVDIKSGKVCGIECNGEYIACKVVILAIGHSARDTFKMLINQGVKVSAKAFSVGVRIEHLQENINKSIYGKSYGNPKLPNAEYQLSLRQNDRAVYTFCMCPGGTVVAAASEDGGIVTNGMSEFAREGKNSNSALVVSVTPADFGHNPLDGVNYQSNLERLAFDIGGRSFKAPIQTVGGFISNSNLFNLGSIAPTYQVGYKEANLNLLFDEKISNILKTGLSYFDKKVTGFSCDDAVLTGVETRTSSPIRIIRGESFEAFGIEGLYPCGEGAGYAGGIMSAAVDGLKISEAVISKYKVK
jgi:uncharacterized FAD-dependent dehydrogenase